MWNAKKEDDLLNARTVVGVWKHTDLLRTYVEGEERGQYSEALTAYKDNVVYSEDDNVTYEQQQVPALMPNSKKKQLVGNSSLGIHAYLYADMPVSIPKGGKGTTTDEPNGCRFLLKL